MYLITQIYFKFTRVWYSDQALLSSRQKQGIWSAYLHTKLHIASLRCLKLHKVFQSNYAS